MFDTKLVAFLINYHVGKKRLRRILDAADCTLQYEDDKLIFAILTFLDLIERALFFYTAVHKLEHSSRFQSHTMVIIYYWKFWSSRMLLSIVS